MPGRGLAVVLFLILAAVAGYYVFFLLGADQATPDMVSKEITSPDGPDALAQGALGPSFDIVRVDRTGQAVIAGRAQAGALVTILSNGKEIAQTTVQDDGTWVAVIEEPSRGRVARDHTDGAERRRRAAALEPERCHRCSGTTGQPSSCRPIGAGDGQPGDAEAGCDGRARRSVRGDR